MSQPRLRVFAGPNGSGKSTLFEAFSQKYPTGLFLNADNIEKDLATKGYIDLADFGLELISNDLSDFLMSKDAQSLIEKAKGENLIIDIDIQNNVIVDKEKNTHSYEGALISAFIRYHLQKNKIDFCFETVMSHPSKTEEIIEAKRNGYKTYLYFICTDSPQVNISRVENRVAKGGHDVKTSKIESRYYQALKNLKSAIENTDKCYFFDNSGHNLALIAQIVDQELYLKADSEELPEWFIDYVLPGFI